MKLINLVMFRDPMLRRGRYFLVAVVLLILVLWQGSRSIPRAAQAATIVRLKLTGSLSDVGWTDLYRIYRSGSIGKKFNLPSLAGTPNPYEVLVNPYTTQEDLAAGNNLFRSRCATCHGPNGAGGPGGPALVHRQMAHGSSDWAVFETITRGVPGTAMPNSVLPWTDKWQLVGYVNSLMMMMSGQPLDSGPAVDHSTKPVSYEDIRHADRSADAWLTYSGSYDAHRFSSGNQITAANAGNLRLLWMRQYETTEPSLETSPLVLNGRMFVTAPPGRVEALDAKTGALIWSYDRSLPEHLKLCCGYGNRGLAVLGKMLYLGTLDAHLIALDIDSGRVCWDVTIANYKEGYSITGAPLALDHVIITGVAGGEFGIQGFVEAREALTGKSVWKFQVIPRPGEAGSDTWTGDSWKTGGGPTWLTGTFDPDANILYWPTGNPSPNFNGDSRSGNNLYTNSVVALDAASGALRWYFQFTPHDAFDWDATEIPVLINKDADGKTQRYLVQANRNAFYYVLDRDKGQFLLARPFGMQTWAETAYPNGPPVIGKAAYPTEAGTSLYPGVGGAANWESPSYSPLTGYVYVAGLDRGGVFFKDRTGYREGEFFLGGNFQYFSRSEGVVSALDPLTGERKWEYRNPAFHVGGLLSTAGGLLFGSQQDRFFALDAKSGREIWRIATNGRIVAAPIAFQSDGKQRITIAAGRDLLTFGL
jgi:alcohol dehydrogenase (cytochrome c)